MAETNKQPVGKVGVAGIGLLCFASSFYFSAVLPMRENVLKSEQDWISLSEKHKQQARMLVEKRAASQGGPSVRKVLNGVEAREYLQALHKVAAEAGIGMESVNYRLETNDNHESSRYVISIPVKAAYPAIRTFIDSVLKLSDSLSLDSLSLQRQRATDIVVDADLTFSLRFVER